ncbi:hypothetical protein Spb1_20760 [Planctopirus ephydatiae]|uniref:Uncharacterized protein n=1 Tax=Planctopirus ephydatiae TaxID=2528019 RepID=A0A518GNF7_9PLAN|nr:hypothetical protein Spb1_20760 [Planctopirus ephydatiae]
MTNDNSFDTKEFCLRNISRILLLLVLFTGCVRQEPAPVAGTTELSGRLEAALAMKDGTAKHNTLVKLAENAAQAGDGEVVLNAIAAVDTGTARDNTCAICSLVLAKHGKTSEATAVAKKIENETQRNNTLTQIATGGNN